MMDFENLLNEFEHACRGGDYEIYLCLRKEIIKKVEKLQQENEKLNQVIDWMNEGCEYNNESHLKTYKQLQQAQAKAERYEKVLKQIASHELFTESYFCDLEANELIYKAQEALEGLNENAKERF